MNKQRLFSWNVNGIRAAEKKGIIDWVKKTKPTVLAIQETKAEANQLSDSLRNIPGYTSYFNASKRRKGYSGTGIYTKEKPLDIVFGMGKQKFDQEGRLITAYYKNFVLVNCYFPNGGMGPERLQFKLEYYDAFLKYINSLRKKGNKVIFCGDVNTAHTEIDLARPKQNEKNTGFLPEEKAWLDKVVKNNWIDTFRHFYPTKKEAYSYWDMKSRARDRNVGWRIDYFFADKALVKKLTGAKIHSKVLGSDHCPVSIEAVL